MAKRERILIACGGIAGLTRAPAWHAVGAGIAVQPNVVRVLRTLGTGAAVARAGAPIARFVFLTQHGEHCARSISKR
jgi:2-polyprenyl-6-methoxyphenol hydroxylase-like FAD-dependent oxidoreductase